ncbi:M56 family metallopeptidase [Labilibacter marinus]|uniref:M56 family metallopeptidase n=1 Tax=Labilibacter marinus TaxID=1477105 RepID=UPI0008344FAD|nr:M56 family metallopeptidase [Labilibacter marinus]
MNSIQSIFSPAITEALGWTIIHAIWQGFVVLIGLLMLLAILNKYSAQVRYFISFTALVILLGWSVSTFVSAYNYAIDKQALRTELLNNPNYFKAAKQDISGQETTAISSSYNIRFIKVRAWFQRSFPLFLSIWLIGIGLFTVRLLGGLAYNRRLRTLQLLPFEEKWMTKLKEYAHTLNIKKNVNAYQSPHTSTPLTLGFVKPIILFPVKAFTGLSDKEIEAIIAHELAHIVRNDYLFNIIQSVIEILFFYHPAVWSISNHIRTEREHACDDIAINVTGDQINYAKALTHAHIFSYQQENLSMAFSKKKGSLLERIKRIQKERAMKTNTSEGLIAACIIISSIFLVSFSVGSQFSNNLIPNKESKTSVETPAFPSPPAASISPEKPVAPAVVKAKKDSMLIEVEKNIEIAKENDELSEEIEQAIEIALSEKDLQLSAEIISEVNAALKDINFDVIVDEALNEARIDIDLALEEINHDSIQKEVRQELKEARKEIREAMKESKHELKDLEEVGEITELSLEAAEAGLEIAADVLKNLDIEAIVETSMEAANIAIEIAHEQIENMNIDSLVSAELEAAELEIDKDEIKRDRKEMEREKKQMLREQEELKKEMEQLKKEMEKMKKELKKELKEIEQD